VTKAFAPGRANLIGEHTDYNDGLALPFAIERGMEVRVTGGGSRAAASNPYVRGVLAELGLPAGTGVEITSDLPQGTGLSSSAALTIAVALALGASPDDPVALARLGQRVENEYAGADTGLLDQLAILLGHPGQAVRIDFRDLSWRHVPVELGGWRLATLDSGAPHSHAAGGYNERRRECRAAAEALGASSLRDATAASADALPAPLGDRVRHVVAENARVDAATVALERGDLAALAALLDESHASLRDLYAASVPEVEATVARAKQAGAVGARMMGGGFGGVVLALFPPDAKPPDDALLVRPAAGARVVSG
jgi:galactokinase